MRRFRFCLGFICGLVFSMTLLLDLYQRPLRTAAPPLPTDQHHIPAPFGISMVSLILATALVLLVVTIFAGINMDRRPSFPKPGRGMKRWRHRRRRAPKDSGNTYAPRHRLALESG
jgi:hypothetical protein